MGNKHSHQDIRTRRYTKPTWCIFVPLWRKAYLQLNSERIALRRDWQACKEELIIVVGAGF